MARISSSGVRRLAARVARVIRVDALWLSIAPLDMRAGMDTILWGCALALALEEPAWRARLRRLAALWLAQSGVRPAEVRFDVVSVLAQPRGAARVEHLRGAF